MRLFNLKSNPILCFLDIRTLAYPPPPPVVCHAKTTYRLKFLWPDYQYQFLGR